MKRIILCGEGGGGKDYLKVKLLEKGLKPSVSYTTRPPRPGEVEGENYHFITVEQFLWMTNEGLFREWNIFGDKKWYYGTTHEHFNAAELFIMTPSGIRALNTAERGESFVVYLNMSEDVRRERIAQRNDADNVDRRLNTDRTDFSDFSDYDLKITDPKFNPDEVFNQIQDVVKQNI